MGAAENMSLPSVPGVYFFWGDAFSGGRGVVYVGKAINLANRVRLGAHHALKDWHHVSYLMMTREVIHYAEAYYIATLRPPLNVANYFQPEGGGSHAKQMKGRLPRKSDAV